jgi:hypothetical protein
MPLSLKEQARKSSTPAVAISANCVERDRSKAARTARSELRTLQPKHQQERRSLRKDSASDP